MPSASCDTPVELAMGSCLEVEAEGASCSSLPASDFYQRLRTSMAEWLRGKGKLAPHAQLLLLAPDLFHLLTRLTLEPRVSGAQKARLALVLAYFIAPVDLMPEALSGPAGYLDDLALAGFALSGLFSAGQGRIASQLWAGEESLIKVIQRLVEGSQAAFGSRALALLRSRLQLPS